MQFTKPMIELVYEIRRLTPSEMKPGVKLANPELFNELIVHYHTGAKTITKALIKELLNLAGGEWSKSLEQQTKNKGPFQTKMYRGVVSLEEQAKNEQLKKENSKRRVYRGQVIA